MLYKRDTKVAPRCKIEFIRSGITEPHIYERLTVLQDVFQENMNSIRMRNGC